MNHKVLALVALFGILSPSPTWSMQDSNVQIISQSQKQNRAASIITEDVNSGQNCHMITEISCSIDSTNQDCGKFFLKRSECMNHGNNGVIDVTMNLSYCNREEERGLQAISERTEILIYNEPVLNLDNSHLVAGLCREKEIKIEVDTCQRGKIVGSLKVEGLADSQPGDDPNLDLYCYGWSFYSTKIIIPESYSNPTSAPTPLPTPLPTPYPDLSHTLTIKCFMKNYDSSNFDIPCEDVDFTQFTFTDNINRSIRLSYIVHNKSNEPLDISTLITNIAQESEATLITPHSNNEPVPAKTEKEIAELYYIVDFKEFSNEVLVIAADVNLSGEESGQISVDFDEYPLHIP